MPIPILVVNAKNLGVFGIASSLAFNNHVSCKHDLANSRKLAFPSRFVAFVNTFAGTKLTFVRRRISKLFIAMLACVLNSALSVHCLVVTRFRAVFGFACAAAHMGKNAATFCAISLNLSSRSQCKTFTTAIKSGIFPVIGNGKCYAAVLALLFNPKSGACCATH